MFENGCNMMQIIKSTRTGSMGIGEGEGEGFVTLMGLLAAVPWQSIALNAMVLGGLESEKEMPLSTTLASGLYF